MSMANLKWTRHKESSYFLQAQRSPWQQWQHPTRLWRPFAGMGLCSSRQKPHNMTGCDALLWRIEFNHITSAVSKWPSLSLGPPRPSSSSCIYIYVYIVFNGCSSNMVCQTGRVGKEKCATIITIMIPIIIVHWYFSCRVQVLCNIACTMVI